MARGLSSWGKMKAKKRREGDQFEEGMGGNGVIENGTLSKIEGRKGEWPFYYVGPLSSMWQGQLNFCLQHQHF